MRDEAEGHELRNVYKATQNKGRNAERQMDKELKERRNGMCCRPWS